MLVVNCPMLLTPKATDTDPPTANSPTMHSRMVFEDPQIKSTGQFPTIYEPKLKILKPPSFHHSFVRSLFVMDPFDKGLL